jgi:hypothetical protein
MQLFFELSNLRLRNLKPKMMRSEEVKLSCSEEECPEKYGFFKTRTGGRERGRKYERMDSLGKGEESGIVKASQTLGLVRKGRPCIRA